MDSTIEKDGTQLLNNKNGSDEKCSQCTRFWLKIIKGILFGVSDLLQNSFDSGLIYRWRKISFKKKQFDLFYLVFNSYASALIKRHPLPKWEMISVDSFSLVLLKAGESWSKSYVSHLWHLLRCMSVDELL